jgi:hypothetical protein
LGVAIAALLLLPSTARAQEDMARDALNAGIKAFEAGAYNMARDRFLEAKRLAPDSANVHRWLGLTDAKVDRCADAVWELEQFLELARPDDKRVPEATAARDKCKEEMKPKLGTLVVESTPSGAEVRIDDPNASPAGVTPYRSDSIVAGNHVVHLALGGYGSESRNVTVQTEREAKLELTLHPSAPPAPPTETPAIKVKAQEVNISTAAPAATGKPRKPKYWIAGVVIGVAAVAALGIGLGVGLSSPPERALNPVTGP